VAFTDPIGYDLYSAAGACAAAGETLYGNNINFATSTSISSSSSCIVTAAGWYSNGVVWKHSTDGTTFDDSGVCGSTSIPPTTSTPSYYTYYVTAFGDTCGAVGSTPWYAANSTATVTSFYSNPGLTGEKLNNGFQTSIGWSVTDSASAADYNGDITDVGDIGAQSPCIPATTAFPTTILPTDAPTTASPVCYSFTLSCTEGTSAQFDTTDCDGVFDVLNVSISSPRVGCYRTAVLVNGIGDVVNSGVCSEETTSSPTTISPTTTITPTTESPTTALPTTTCYEYAGVYYDASSSAGACSGVGGTIYTDNETWASSTLLWDSSPCYEGGSNYAPDGYYSKDGVWLWWSTETVLSTGSCE